MSEFLFNYHAVAPTTWAYLSSLLMIGLFFKFGRFWSVRNLDLLLLILLAPGLILVLLGEQAATPHSARRPDLNRKSGNPGADLGEPQIQAVPPGVVTPRVPWDPAKTMRTGYICLFVACGLILVRLLLDSAMVRRPLLEPNLTLGGLTFIGGSLFIFLMANVIAGYVTSEQVRANLMEAGSRAATDEPTAEAPPAIEVPKTVPGYPLLRSLSPPWSKVVSIGSQLAIVFGLALIGLYHFDNLTNGIGAATLYLMLPYTAIMTNHPDHSLPAAMLLGAVYCYRRPVAAGILLGLASATVYYPFYMLPLWLSFYWPRGLARFLVGFTVTVVAMFIALPLSGIPFGEGTRQMFGLWPPRTIGLEGIWNPAIGGWEAVFRLPVLATFVMLSCSFAIWPPQKNLGTLISCSAAIMVATQFWHGDRGGMQMAWYLPLLLLTIFRPNLEDRVAMRVLSEDKPGT